MARRDIWNRCVSNILTCYIFYKRVKIEGNLHSLLFTWTQRVKSESMYQFFLNEEKFSSLFGWRSHSNCP